MEKSISCWDCKCYDEYDVNDYESEYYCEHDIKTQMDKTDGDVHPKHGCVMFEKKQTKTGASDE